MDFDVFFRSLVRKEREKAVHFYRVVEIDNTDISVQSLILNDEQKTRHNVMAWERKDVVASLLPCNPGEMALRMTFAPQREMKIDLVWVSEELSSVDMPMTNNAQVKLLVASTNYLEPLRRAYEARMQVLTEKAKLEEDIRAATGMEELKTLLMRKPEPDLLRQIKKFEEEYPDIELNFFKKRCDMDDKLELLRYLMRKARPDVVFYYKVALLENNWNREHAVKKLLEGWDGRDIEALELKPVTFSYASLVKCSPGDIVLATISRNQYTHHFVFALVTANVYYMPKHDAADTNEGIILARTDFPMRLGNMYRKAVREKNELESRIRREMEKAGLTSFLAGKPDLQKRVMDFQKNHPELSLNM